MNHNKAQNYFLLCIICASLILAGGYFEYVSCIISIPLLLWIGYKLFKEKKIEIPLNMFFISSLMVVGFYLLSSLWAIDSGMAFLGFLKFLPMVLFGMLCIRELDKDWIISKMPYIGVAMTILSFVMSMFDIFKPYVLVAGRLAGFFQYPNTYALFLLVCIVIAFWEEQAINQLYICIMLAGIYLSGSRTVYVLTVFVFLIVFAANKSARKFIAIVVGLGAVCLGILIVFGKADRLTSISISSSTFVGRLLYYKDALRVIGKHPFGLGYYGYYFLEQEIQTGVYSIVNVHNELLQFIVDIGIFPALLFFFSMVRAMLCKENKISKKVALLMIFLHSMLDYDFQFVSICLLVVLLIPEGKTSTNRISAFSLVIYGVINCCIFVEGFIYGMSNYFQILGQNERAYSINKHNTVAEINLLSASKDLEEIEDFSKDILRRNKHVPLVYGSLANVKVSEGDVESYIAYKEKELDLAPYQHESYWDYVDVLNTCANIYLSNGDRESALICYKYMKHIPERLEGVKEKTSKLAWDIDDTPVLNLPIQYQEMIEEMGRNFNENQ